MNKLSDEQRKQFFALMIKEVDENNVKITDINEKEIEVPPREEVNEAINFTVDKLRIPKNVRFDDDQTFNLKSSDSVIAPTHILEGEKRFKIENNKDGNLYNSVSKYVISKLYSLLPGDKYKLNNINARSSSYEDLVRDYPGDRESAFKSMLREKLRICFIERYKDVYAKEVLRLTGDKNLFFYSNYDAFAKNYIGKELGKIRNYIKNVKSYIFDKNDIINTGNIINRDPYLETWVKIRVIDFNKNVNRFFKYYTIKNIIEIDDSVAKENVFKLVLKYIYNPVNLVSVNSIKIVDDRAPYYFEVLVGGITKDPLLIKYSYMYIISLLTYLFVFGDRDLEKMKKVIFNSQLDMNKGPNCYDADNKFSTRVVKSDTKFKCVIPTYLTFFRIISKIQKELNPDIPPTFDNGEIDLQLIESIILGFPFPNKKRKKAVGSITLDDKDKLLIEQDFNNYYSKKND